MTEIQEILTRELPFYHVRDNNHVIIHIASGVKPREPDFLGDVGDTEIDRFLWSICLKCWEPNPGSRPPISEVEEEIDMFLQSRK